MNKRNQPLPTPQLDKAISLATMCSDSLDTIRRDFEKYHELKLKVQVGLITDNEASWLLNH